MSENSGGGLSTSATHFPPSAGALRVWLLDTYPFLLEDTVVRAQLSLIHELEANFSRQKMMISYLHTYSVNVKSVTFENAQRMEEDLLRATTDFEVMVRQRLCHKPPSPSSLVLPPHQEDHPSPASSMFSETTTPPTFFVWPRARPVKRPVFFQGHPFSRVTFVPVDPALFAGTEVVEALTLASPRSLLNIYTGSLLLENFVHLTVSRSAIRQIRFHLPELGDPHGTIELHGVPSTPSDQYHSLPAGVALKRCHHFFSLSRDLTQHPLFHRGFLVSKFWSPPEHSLQFGASAFDCITHQLPPSIELWVSPCSSVESLLNLLIEHHLSTWITMDLTSLLSSPLICTLADGLFALSLSVSSAGVPHFRRSLEAFGYTVHDQFFRPVLLKAEYFSVPELQLQAQKHIRGYRRTHPFSLLSSPDSQNMNISSDTHDHMKLALSVRQPLRSHVMMELHRAGSCLFTQEYLEQHSDQLFECGPMMSASQIFQLFDAFWWSHMAPLPHRQDFTAILRHYYCLGVRVRLLDDPCPSSSSASDPPDE